MVIENRQNVLSKIANTALLMSPLERSACFVQASWRRRLCMLYPKRYKERQQQQPVLLEGDNIEMSDVTSSPFVTVSVTSKKSSVSSSGSGMEESGGGGGVEMTNIDVNTKGTILCIGLSKRAAVSWMFFLFFHNKISFFFLEPR